MVATTNQSHVVGLDRTTDAHPLSTKTHRKRGEFRAFDQLSGRRPIKSLSRTWKRLEVDAGILAVHFTDGCQLTQIRQTPIGVKQITPLVDLAHIRLGGRPIELGGLINARPALPRLSGRASRPGQSRSPVGQGAVAVVCEILHRRIRDELVDAGLRVYSDSRQHSCHNNRQPHRLTWCQSQCRTASTGNPCRT